MVLIGVVLAPGPGGLREITLILNTNQVVHTRNLYTALLSDTSCLLATSLAQQVKVVMIDVMVVIDVMSLSQPSGAGGEGETRTNYRRGTTLRLDTATLMMTPKREKR